MNGRQVITNYVQELYDIYILMREYFLYNQEM